MSSGRSDSIYPGCGMRIGVPGRETTCGDRGICSRCFRRRMVATVLDERVPVPLDDDELRELTEAIAVIA